MSPHGDNTWSGETSSAPLKTLKRAADRLEAAVAAGLPSNGAIVEILEGVYNEPLELTTVHSGASKTRRVVWRAYKGANVVLTGATEIPAAAFKKITADAPAAFKKVTANAPILVADIPGRISSSPCTPNSAREHDYGDTFRCSTESRCIERGPCKGACVDDANTACACAFEGDEGACVAVVGPPDPACGTKPCDCSWTCDMAMPELCPDQNQAQCKSAAVARLCDWVNGRCRNKMKGCARLYSGLFGFELVYREPGTPPRLMQIARWPNGAPSGKADWANGTGDGGVAWTAVADQSADLCRRGVLKLANAQIKPTGWTAEAVKHAWVQLYIENHGAYITYERVCAVEPTSGPVTGVFTDRLPNGKPAKVKGWYALNIPDELDARGEYYYDPAAAKLYLSPPLHPKCKGRNAHQFRSFCEDARAVLHGKVFISTQRRPLVEIKGASHVTFRGLRFENSRRLGLSVKEKQSGNWKTPAKDVVVERCSFRNLGSTAAHFRHADDCGVRDSTFESVGGAAAFPHYTMTKHGGAFVTNNDITRATRWCRGNAVRANGANAVVGNNRMRNIGYQAVVVGGPGAKVVRNEIANACRNCSDNGAIYLGKVSSSATIERNYLHDLTGGPPIYLDNCASAIRIKRNVFSNIQTNVAAIVVAGGRKNEVFGNVFRNVKERPVLVTSRVRGYPYVCGGPVPTTPPIGNEVRDNTVCDAGSDLRVFEPRVCDKVRSSTAPPEPVPPCVACSGNIAPQGAYPQATGCFESACVAAKATAPGPVDLGPSEPSCDGTKLCDVGPALADPDKAMITWWRPQDAASRGIPLDDVGLKGPVGPP